VCRVGASVRRAAASVEVTASRRASALERESVGCARKKNFASREFAGRARAAARNILRDARG
jgi:hypothetical protein